MSDLKGKTAIVTGATSGIGMETAAALAGRGATVVLGCRNTAAATKVAAAIKQRHPRAVVDVGLPLDLMSQSSIKAFAAEVNRNYSTLNILVNNAGVSYMPKVYTDEGVGGIAQTNHMGAYTLTRLLERKLVDCRARVVTVASVTHRSATMRSAKAFLCEWRSGYYEHSKLANVLFAYELQRRLGAAGVQSVAADPGGVRSGIWDASPSFKKGFKRWVVDMCYSPPSDGAQAVIYAATVPWSKDRPTLNGAPLPPPADFRYYSRGLFRNPLINRLDGTRGGGWTQDAKASLWATASVVSSLLDWPLRRLSGGWLFSGIAPVRSSTQSYDARLAAELWDASAEVAGLPSKPTAGST